MNVELYGSLVLTHVYQLRFVNNWIIEPISKSKLWVGCQVELRKKAKPSLGIKVGLVPDLNQSCWQVGSEFGIFFRQWWRCRKKPFEDKQEDNLAICLAMKWQWSDTVWLMSRFLNYQWELWQTWRVDNWEENWTLFTILAMFALTTVVFLCVSWIHRLQKKCASISSQGPLSLSLDSLPCHKALVLKVSGGSQVSQLEFITQFFPLLLSPPLSLPGFTPSLLSRPHPHRPLCRSPLTASRGDQLGGCLIRVWTTAAAMLLERPPWHTVSLLASGLPPAAEAEGASRSSSSQSGPAGFCQKLPKKKTNRKNLDSCLNAFSDAE